MRKNHAALQMEQQIPQMDLDQEDETFVNWVHSQVLNGQHKPCDPNIRFKCHIFINGTMIKSYLHAEPQRGNPNGSGPPVIFRIFDVRMGIECLIDYFDHT